MDAVAARKLLGELVKSEQLEVRRVDSVAKHLAAFVHELGRPPSSRELDDWLDGQPMVTESYATDAVLEVVRSIKFDVSQNEFTRTGLATLAAFSPLSTRQHRAGSSAERRVRTFAGSRLVAAEGIADPKLWRNAGIEGDVRWARYRGDDLYELFITTDLRRYGCTCPSSIQPCKHVVALALIAERTSLRAAPSEGIEGRVDRYDRVTE